MLSNELKISLRLLFKSRTFSLVNILGLTAGSLCCLYILIFVREQYRYDEHHRSAENIYRITTELGRASGEKFGRLANSSPPIAPALKADFPEVNQFTRVVHPPGVSHHLLRFEEKSMYETSAIYADSTFFDVFNFHFVHGNAASALREPFTIVLSQGTALKLFGSTDPVNKVIEVDNSYGRNKYRVTGVVDESNGKSHIEANLFFTMNSGGIGEYVRTNDAWAGNNFISGYLRLQPGTDPNKLKAKFPAFLKKYGGEQLTQLGLSKELFLQPVTEIHTTTGLEAEPSKTISPVFLSILLSIAALIQLIACINFMNLSTARSAKRAREVGVRKVIGARKSELVRQFLTESLLMSILAVILALPLLYVCLPYLNSITDSNITLKELTSPQLLLIILGLMVSTGLLAGSYPAFYLSDFNIINVIKGKLNTRASGIPLRQGLVVFQFVLSVVLIIGIIVINKQLSYINSADLGFEKDQRLIITFRTEDARRQMNAFSEEIKGFTEVSKVARANNYPSQFYFNDLPMYLAGQNMEEAKLMQFMYTEEGFVDATGIRLKAGSDFHRNDSGRVLVNEAALRSLGIRPDQAVGTKIYSNPDPSSNYLLTLEIAGVIQDFNFNSLKTAVRPLMLVYRPDEGMMSHLIIATSSNDYKSLLSKMSSTWKKLLPYVPFDYAFLDEEVHKQYQAELTLSKIINAFTLMAVLICCLGLFGLSAFTAEQRTKEIGIRKVLGASVSTILSMLSKDFLRLVLIAILIASPIAWWVANQWLQDYHYRTNLSWWIFATAAGIAIVIAVITVSIQAIKAAIANPVNSLRQE